MTQKCIQKIVAVRQVFLPLAAVCFLAAISAVQAANLVQDFYLPMPEGQILQAEKTISPGTHRHEFLHYTSILTTGNGTVIYYDQWEDGFEANLAGPTQATTQIWGDGNDANGIFRGLLTIRWDSGGHGHYAHQQRFLAAQSRADSL